MKNDLRGWGKPLKLNEQFHSACNKLVKNRFKRNHKENQENIKLEQCNAKTLINSLAQASRPGCPWHTP